MILNKILQESAQKYPDSPALTMKMGYRTATFTYKNIEDLSKKVALFLEKNGIGKGDKVLICAPNSPYWVCVFWATMLRGAVIVPLNVQSTKQIIQRIVDQTDAKIIFKHIFFKHELSENIKQFDIEFIEDLVEEFLIENFQEINISENDLMQIMYTSGTTGDPKGVMLTHKNIYSNLETISEIIIVTSGHDKALSILPLSHIYEQTMGFLLPFWHGVQIIYVHSYSAIRSLMKQYQITKMVAVPEFLQLMMSRIEFEAETKGRKKLFNKLMHVSKKLNNKFISRILFYPVIKGLGGKLDTIASGGAALDTHLEEKWISLGIYVLQGYGLTETSPVVASNTYTDFKIGSVGKVISGVEVKFGSDNEILVKGPNVFLGYFKDEQKTKDVFTQDNFFKTGDLGEFDSDNFLYVKGRKKYLIKGPGGQNVYPEDIELELNKIEGVQDSCVLGLEKSSGAVEIHAVLLLDLKKENIDLEKIIEQANSNLASYQQIGGWSVWQDIDFPRTVTRKIKKDEVRKFLEGKQKGLTKVSDQKKSRLIQILSQITGTDVSYISESTKIVHELNIDSLMRVELVSCIEEELGVVIEESAITPKTTVKDLEELIKVKKPIKESTRLKKWPRSWWASILRMILQPLFFLIIRIFVKLKVEGKENLQNLDLPVVLMPNHVSFIDSVVVCMAAPWHIRKKLAFAAASDVLYGEYKYAVWFAELLFNSFPIQRGETDNIKLGLDYIGQMLDQKFSVVIFPEGRMSETGNLLELRRGAGLVAVEMHSYIVPVKIVGSNSIVPYGKIFPIKRGEIKVIFGKPIKFKRSDSYALAMEKIHDSIKNL